MSYTNTDLVSDIRQLAALHSGESSSDTWNTDNILQRAFSVLIDEVVPTLITTRSEHFVWEATQSITSGTAEYDIPYRAMGMVLRDMFLTDSNGNDTDISYLDPEDRELRASTGGPQLQWYFRWNKIVLMPSPTNSNDSLKIPYLIRPGKLVDTDEAMQITAIDTGTNTVTGSAVPSDFTDGANYDFVKGSGSHEYLAIDQASSSSTATTVVFSSLPTGLAVGDWLCQKEQSAVPMLPREWSSVLAHATAYEILEAQGDAKASKALERYQRKLKSVLGLAEPRVQGEPAIVMTNVTRRREYYQ